jgi:prepilin-type N-terminal cleavage/methylation domain-containing protein
MKKQSGFTLIELLLVLAIIGIISAIAIPALLGQRARARDKSAMSNVTAILPDMVSEYDKLKEGGTAPAVITDIIGATSATALIPEAWSATNPWATAGATEGYNTAAFVAEAIANPGAATAAKAVVGNMGQVQLGYLAPAGGVNGLFAASVYLNGQITVNGAKTNNFTQTAGVD